jgi:hypothetical protein
MVLALNAVAGCVALVGASQAGAKTLGTVSLRIHEYDPSANAHWGEAWDACRRQHPARALSTSRNPTGCGIQLTPKLPGRS